jgi:hypothetical protein
MTIQQGQNYVVGYKAQPGLGSPASGAGGTGMRFNEGSQGFEFNRTQIANPESRADGVSSKDRLGSGRSPGTFAQTLCVGEPNTLIEALLRGTFVAETTITQAAMTSITTTTSTIVAAAGSWLTQGVRKGDKVKLTGHSTVANNGKWFRVLDVSALTITVPTNSLTADGVADTSFSLMVAKTCINGNPPVERYATWDQYNRDIDLSELFTDVKVCKLELSAQPDGNVILTWTFLGLAGMEQAAGSSPVLTSPTYTTTLPLVFSDGVIRVGGVDYNVMTSFSFVYDLGGEARATNALNPPDVTLMNAKLSGSFAVQKQDTAFFAAARQETKVEIWADFIETNDVDPKDFASFYVGNATLQKASGPLGGTGPAEVTVPWFAGKDEAGGASAATLLKYSTSV